MVSPASRGLEITPASDLTRPARLEEADACRGYFPPGATSDRASAVVSVVVRANGRVASASIVEESPPAEGFGAAAKACLLAKEFAPALGRSGEPTNAAATVRVHFSR